MKNLTPRTWSMILGGIALAALILLAASLDGLALKEGIPLPLKQMAPDLGGSQTSPEWLNALLAVFRVLMIFVWVLLPAYIIYLLFSKEARKRLLRDLAIILPVLLLLYLLSNNQQGRQLAQDMTGQFGKPQDEQMAEMAEPPPLPEFQPPPVWISTAVSLALGAGAVLILAGIGYMIWRRARQNEAAPLWSLQEKAREAIQQIEAGGDLGEVIQRCYHQMVDVLRQTRHIYRNKDVTPHEFELLLEEQGLPREPVHQLTSLFELVRYGGQRPGRAEEQIAINSLNNIISALERAQERENPRSFQSPQAAGKGR